MAFGMRLLESTRLFLSNTREKSEARVKETKEIQIWHVWLVKVEKASGGFKRCRGQEILACEREVVGEKKIKKF